MLSDRKSGVLATEHDFVLTSALIPITIVTAVFPRQSFLCKALLKLPRLPKTSAQWRRPSQDQLVTAISKYH